MSLIICLFGCVQKSDDYVNDAIGNLYIKSYEILIEKQYDGDESEVLESKYDNLVSEFQNEFADGTFVKYSEYARELMTINTIKENDDIKTLAVDNIEINETGEKQYSYTITLLVNDTSQEISQGMIRFDKNHKIEYFKITKIPSYVDIPGN